MASRHRNGLLLLILAVTAFVSAAYGGLDRPNVILIMTDDQGWGDVGYQGHPELKTPHLDEMARTGIRFERFYAAAPVCSPTRGSCLSGRHPYRYGIRGANNGHILDREHLLSEILRDAGYTTGHFGKWHLGTLTKTQKDSNRGGPGGVAHYAPPWDHGFDVCFSTEAKVPTYDPMVTPNKIAGGVGKLKPGEPYGTAYWDGPASQVTKNLAGDDSKLIMDRAVPFIESAAAQDTPFFAVIWFHAPHLPVVAGTEHREPYQHLSEFEQHYFGCITALDQQVGRLRTALDELNVADNTMIWFCSDNGPEGAEGKAPGNTSGLRGRKRSLYEGGVRVPGLLVWPARFPTPRTVTAPCSTLDYLPTILGSTGIEPRSAALDGVNLIPVLDGKTSKRGKPLGFQHRAMAVWMTDQYKLVRHGAGDDASHELYDIPHDPAERLDLADGMPDVVDRLAEELDAWQASCAESAASK